MIFDVPPSSGFDEELRETELRALRWFRFGTPIILAVSIVVGVALAWLN